jgi:hypothetical protein
MAASQYTPGPWRIGKMGSVVTDTPPNAEYAASKDAKDIMEWYGGYVVAESIGYQDQSLIAAAPDLLTVCESLLNEGAEMASYQKIALRAAVRKARGEEVKTVMLVADAR